MKDNGIVLRSDGTVDFTRDKLIPEEQKVISEIWQRLSKYDTITPSEIDDLMQYLSKLEYRTNVTDKVGSVYIDVMDSKTGEIKADNVFRYIRNTYDALLEQVDNTGRIKDLRKQYSAAKSITGPIEDSWFKGFDLTKTTDAELADAASLALRRLDSRAKSRTTYGQIYRALDKYSRANGYKGPDAADVSNFYVNTVEPLYTQTTPEASFRGGITGGIRSVFENVFDFGKANVNDKQKALKALLDMEATKPVNPAAVMREATQSEARSVDSTLNRIEGRLSESSRNSSDLNRNKQGGFARFFGNQKDDAIQQSIDEIETQIKRFEDRGVSPNSAPYKRLMQEREKLYNMFGSFNQSATTKTTDLLEEARPYFADPRKIPKTEQDFIEAHTIYHGANTKFADQLEKTKSFKPGAKREAGTGGNFYGLSATTDARMAQDFSTSATGEGRVVELYIDPKAKVLNMRGKALDDLTEAETKKLAKEYDVIRDIDNVGGESEVRILNPDILRDRSQIESAWVLQDTGITDLYKD